jgi:ATP-binding cassette subfamily G (WHITE) protein 2 (SNQ2)
LGIIIAFLVGFMALLLLFSEYNTSTTFDSSVTLFKRGTKRVVRSKSDEEEKRSFDASSTSAMLSRKKGDAPLKMNDTFTWKNLNYTVPIPGEDDRQLLSNVSGYVAPGKLTALMGESGAGKTTLLNVLARRVDTGVVTGEMFVNGQALPRDFQSQTYVFSVLPSHLILMRCAV